MKVDLVVNNTVPEVTNGVVKWSLTGDELSFIAFEEDPRCVDILVMVLARFGMFHRYFDGAPVVRQDVLVPILLSILVNHCLVCASTHIFGGKILQPLIFLEKFLSVRRPLLQLFLQLSARPWELVVACFLRSFCSHPFRPS